MAVCAQDHGSRNITAEGLTLLDSGGDGVYLSIIGGKTELAPTDIVLRDLVCDRNHRQGISVISARRRVRMLRTQLARVHTRRGDNACDA